MKNWPRVILLFASLVPATAASAQDPGVKTTSDSAQLGGEFRAELNYDDHGFENFGSNKPDATTELQVQTVALKLEGKINPATEYAFQFNLLDAATTPLEIGYGTHFMGPVAISMGRMLVLQGGWDNIDYSYKDHVQGPYADNLAFDTYVDMIAVELNVVGKITLQVFDDVSEPDAEWNRGRHPTFVLGVQGAVGQVASIFNFGSYDNNKSRWIDLGAKTTLGGVRAILDLKFDTVARRDTAPDFDPSDEAKELNDTGRSVTFKATYEIPGSMMPWIYVSSYQLVRADDAPSVNSFEVDSDGKKTYLFDDNGKAFGIGTDLLMLGNGWTPYVAFVAKMGDFATDDVDPTEKSKRAQNQLRLGVLGDF